MCLKVKLVGIKAPISEIFRSDCTNSCWMKHKSSSRNGVAPFFLDDSNLISELDKCSLHVGLLWYPLRSCGLILFHDFCLSQELLERFMEASLGLDDFLDSFQSSRKTYHIRRAKAEKIQEVSRGRQQPEKSKPVEGSKNSEAKKTLDQPQGSQLPNGFIAQGPLRVFQVRYGLRPAILLPHCNVSPTTSVPGHQASSPPPEPQVGPSLSPTSPLPGHGQPIGLRVIGQLPGGWPATGRPVRLQQLYRLSPQQTEPPFR